MFKYHRRLTNFKLASNASLFPESDMSARAFSQDRWTSDIKVEGAGMGLPNRVYRRMRVLARVITSAWAPMAILRRDLVPGKMSSCHGVLGSAGGLDLLTAEVVVLWVASGDEYGGTLKDVEVGGVYPVPWIIRRGAAGVCLTGAAPCHPDVVETGTVETRLFACRLSAVRGRRRVPGTVSSSGISFSSACRSVSDSVGSDLREFWYSSLLSSLRRTVSICGGASVSPKCLVDAVVCNVLLLGLFVGRDGRHLLICGVEEL